MSKRLFLVVCLFCLCGCESEGSVNVALHSSYTLQPKPNYTHCTDAADAVQLTDGAAYGSYWVKKSTVGWSRASTGIEITIDLKRPSPVDTVKVHSVGGGNSSVEFPEFIVVLVSNDGIKYGFAGVAGSRQLKRPSGVDRKRIPYVFAVENLNTSGRFVKIVVRQMGSFFFLDEIEVFGNMAPSVAGKTRRTNLLRFNDNERLLEFSEDNLQFRDNIYETERFLRDNRNRFSKEFFAEISSQVSDITALCIVPTDMMHSRDGQLSLRKKIHSIRARVYFELYKKPFACFVANPMRTLLEKDMQLAVDGGTGRIDMQMWRSEYESAAVNIVNCSQEPLSLVASVSPITGPAGRRFESRQAFTVRRAVFTKALGVGLTGDALVLQPEEPFTLQPGQTTQIWLSFFNPVLAAGTYRASLGLLVSGDKGSETETIPIEIRILPRVFPQQVALNTCTWAYPTLTTATRGNLAEAIDDLRAHHTSVMVVPSQDLPMPRRVSPYGDLVGPMDYTRLDRLLSSTDFARTWLVYCAFKQEGPRGRFGKWLTPEWKRAFSSWVFELVNHLKSRGISYDNFALYPFDEKLGDEFYEVARLIKRIDPKVRIYANWFGKGPKDFMRFKHLVDIWCPPDRHCYLHPEWLRMLKSFNKEIWTYGVVGPGDWTTVSKAKDTYGSFRLAGWRTFKRGCTGSGFWVYLDYHAKSWNDTMRPNGCYSVVYIAQQSSVDTHGENIVPSRRWEAWREGVEDYQYLHDLKEIIELTEYKDPQKADKARKVLGQQVDYVLQRPDDRGAVYKARQVLNEMFLELESGGKE